QVMTGERVLPEVDHQKPADAVDEIGKIFAEIEARAIGHECEIPTNCWANAFMGRLAPCQRRARLDRLRDWPHNAARLPREFCCIYNNSKCIYDATQSQGCGPASQRDTARQGRSVVEFGYFTLSDNHYENNPRTANQFVTDITEEALHADKLGMHSAWIGEHHFNSLGLRSCPER